MMMDIMRGITMMMIMKGDDDITGMMI